jgi:hypothetical protein
MSNLIDSVGGANLFSYYIYSYNSYVPDRFCSANSAIYIYLQAPSRVYFSGDFTVTAWIYLKYSLFTSSSFFSFGNSFENDNILVAISNTYNIYGNIRKGTTNAYIYTSTIINLRQWYFISFVLSGTTGYIYINGNQVGTSTLNVPNNITRTANYINQNADVICNELKIYQGSLSSANILNEYQISSNNGIMNFFFLITK